MKNIKRELKIALPKRQSAFLWGARKTGKSTFLKTNFPDSLYYDFLKTDLFLETVKNPSILRERILAKDENTLKKPIILDEVQKVPQILDEVHWMIENKKLQFILCGSSARKVKHGHSNLLGGRAWRFEMFPFISKELEKVDLLKALNNGLIPSHYFQKTQNARLSLKAYIQNYLKEEVFAEGLTRNIPAFSRFFDSFAYSHGEETNYANIARDCGVDNKTVKEYYQILIDTLLACRIEPFKKTQTRQVITKSPKYYLFDVGIAGFMTKRIILEENGAAFGKAFEHFILMELNAYNSYRNLDFSIEYWRTKTGLEVDFILNRGQIAVEIKGSKKVDTTELKGLKAYAEEFKPKRCIVVCNESERRIIDKIEFIPWREFLIDLWNEVIL